MTTILVADEQALYRTGLRVVINDAVPEAEFLEAEDLPALLRLLERHGHVDLALISLALIEARGPDVIRDLRKASFRTRYGVIATDCSFDLVLRYVAEGFQGFVSKLQRDDEIVASVADLLAGRLSVPAGLVPAASRREEPMPRRASARRPSWQQNPFGLTPRQRAVLGLLADGLSNREIAQALHIAEPTTKIHVSALMRALNVRNRTEAAVLAKTLFRAIERNEEGDR
jgi:DNA-binding NarL/FixJ family response regulator